MEIFAEKSKKFLVTSLWRTANTGTYCIIRYNWVTFLFSAQHACSRKDDLKMVRLKRIQLRRQIKRKSKTPAQNPAEKPKTPAPETEPKPALKLRRNPLRNRKRQPKNQLRNLKIQVLKRISPNLQLALLGRPIVHEMVLVTNKWIFDKKLILIST